jgi:gluconokinase
VVDVALASATGLLDVVRKGWDPDALELAGVAPRQLSEPVPMTHVVEGLAGSDARRLALARDTPFIVGGSDGALSSIGLGATSPGIAAASVGTSAAVRTCARRPGGDRDGVTFCYALGEELWLRGAASNSGGAALSWLQSLLRGSTAGLEDLLSSAAEVPAGADGLLFLPYLHGERAPRPDPAARAVLFGLQAHHGAPHIARAVLEGVALQVATVVALVDEVAGPVSELRVGGGLTRAPLWRRILTDCIGRSVAFSGDPEASLRGAALVALEALGEGDGTAGNARPPLERSEPTEESVAYGALLSRFKDLLRRVEPLFAAAEEGTGG